MSTETTSNSPTHDVMFVQDRKGKFSPWTKIGAGWAHKDGGGMSLDLRLMPVDLKDGRIVIRLRDSKNEEVGQ